jgi:hypothetical protein
MKTQTHYTTSVEMVSWMRRNAAALAAVLALAGVVGLLFALGQFGHPSHSATRGAAAAPARSLIALCRACADESLGAAQAAQSSLPSQVVASSAAPRTIGSRLFRDEVLGADQANLAFLSLNTAHRRSESARASAAPVMLQRLAGSRAFRDEVLGADQANLASLSAPGSALDQWDEPRRPSPR